MRVSFTSLPPVRMTNRLHDDLIAEGVSPDELARLFAEWKQNWPVNEHEEWYFGKDGYYAKPVRNGKMVLCHVHLLPQNDGNALRRWEKNFERKSRKESDCALIYAEDPRHGYLLINILWDPGAHDFSAMTSPMTKKLMEQFADVAEKFQLTGEIMV